MKSIKLMLLSLCVAFGAQQAQALPKIKEALQSFEKKHGRKVAYGILAISLAASAVCMTDMYGVTDSSTWMDKASSGIASGFDTVRPWLNYGWNSIKNVSTEVWQRMKEVSLFKKAGEKACEKAGEKACEKLFDVGQLYQHFDQFSA